VWSVLGQRYFLSLELEDSPLARRVAEAKAKLIEADIVSGNFDQSLEKYKPESQRKSAIQVVEVVEAFLKMKAKQVTNRTMEKYHAFGTHPKRYFNNKAIMDVGEAQADQFRLDLLTRDLDLATVKHKYFRHYTEFVEFRLDTGCRIAEAAGLRFKHISDDYSQVWIGETYSRGEWKPVKRNEARWLNLPKRAQQIIKKRAAQASDPNAIVFPGPRGAPIDDQTFSQRIWTPMLEQVNVEHRVFYNTRHTVVSQALEAGMSPTAIADQTGHRVETLLKHYAGNVQNRPRLPRANAYVSS
jgi:integrase